MNLNLSRFKKRYSKEIKKYLSSFFLLLIAGTAICAAADLEKDIKKKDIEVLYFGARNDMAFLGLGQGLGDSSKGEDIGFRLKTESENFRPFSDPKPDVIFAAIDSESIRLLSVLNPDIPIFNLIDDSPLIRQLCLKNVFHIVPSASMRADAKREWLKKNQISDIEIQAWHHDYNVGKAKELNQLFREKRQVQLSEQGWAGWVAARIFAYNFFDYLRKSSGDFIAYLKKETRLDDYKGAVMRFRPDGQLIQAMLVVKDARFIGKEPDSGTKRALDKFGHLYCSD